MSYESWNVYSLTLLEPDFVKLDMHLVRSANQDPRTARLVRHIVEHASAENMLVVAEGIETEDEKALVTDLGCHLLQGFLFSRPQPIEKFL